MIIGKKRSEREYRSLDILSASDLRRYVTKGRKDFFYRCILKRKEEDEESRASKIGSITHCLLLEPEEFDNKYFMSLCVKPPSGNMKKFVDALFKHTLANTDENGEVQLEFKELAELAYADSEIKKPGLEGVIANFKAKDPEMYYRELRACETLGKEIVCTEDRNIADKIIETLQNNDYTKDLFTNRSQKEVQFDDFEIDGLAMKAMLDDIDDTQEEIVLTDLKVTWTNEEFFWEHFLKKRADIQAYVYTRAVEQKYPGRKVRFRFVAADSTNFNSPLIYEIGKEWMDKTYNGFTLDNRVYKGVKDIVEEIKWHNKTGNWTISKQSFENQGIIKL